MSSLVRRAKQGGGRIRLTGVARHLTVTDPLIKARLHRGAGGAVLYVINLTSDERPVMIELPESVRSAEDAWQHTPVRIDGRRLILTVSDRNAAVLRFN